MIVDITKLRPTVINATAIMCPVYDGDTLCFAVMTEECPELTRIEIRIEPGQLQGLILTDEVEVISTPTGEGQSGVVSC